MANIFQVNPYQINSMDPIAAAAVANMGFPSAGVMLRSALDANGNPGALLSNGIRCYGQINVLATGATYLTINTLSQLVTLANA